MYTRCVAPPIAPIRSCGQTVEIFLGTIGHGSAQRIAVHDRLAMRARQSFTRDESPIAHED